MLEDVLSLFPWGLDGCVRAELHEELVREDTLLNIQGVARS